MIYLENLTTVNEVEHNITSFGELTLSNIRLYCEEKVKSYSNDFDEIYLKNQKANNTHVISISILHEQKETTEFISSVVFDIFNNNFSRIVYANSNIKWISELCNFIIKNVNLSPLMKFSPPT